MTFFFLHSITQSVTVVTGFTLLLKFELCIENFNGYEIYIFISSTSSIYTPLFKRSICILKSRSFTILQNLSIFVCVSVFPSIALIVCLSIRLLFICFLISSLLWTVCPFVLTFRILFPRFLVIRLSLSLHKRSGFEEKN